MSLWVENRMVVLCVVAELEYYGRLLFIFGREEVFFVGWTGFDMGSGVNLNLTNIATKISMTRT